MTRRQVDFHLVWRRLTDSARAAESREISRGSRETTPPVRRLSINGSRRGDIATFYSHEAVVRHEGGEFDEHLLSCCIIASPILKR